MVWNVTPSNSLSNYQRFDYRLIAEQKTTSVHRHGRDKTVLSSVVGGVNRIGDKSRLFSVVINILETEQFCPVLSAVWTRFQTSPSCKSETGSRQDKTLFTSHFETGRNSFEIFCCHQSWVVANSVQTVDTDKTRQCSRVSRCDPSINCSEMLKTQSDQFEACPLTKTQLHSLNCAMSSSFTHIFNVRSDEIIYLCRYMSSCLNTENTLCIRKDILTEILLAR